MCQQIKQSDVGLFGAKLLSEQKLALTEPL